MKLATRETIERRYVDTFKTGNADKEGKPVNVNSKSITKLELMEVYLEMANKQEKTKNQKRYILHNLMNKTLDKAQTLLVLVQHREEVSLQRIPTLPLRVTIQQRWVVGEGLRGHHQLAVVRNK